MNSTDAEVLPVMLFSNCNSAVPGTARLALCTGLATVVLPMIVVGSWVPFQRTTVWPVMLAPTTCRVVLLAPAVIVCGIT